MSSPLDITIAIHYYTRPGDYAGFKHDGCGHPNSELVRQRIRDMVNGGLLRERTSCEHPANDAKYIATDAMRVYIEALCKVRWPVQVWVVPKDEQTHGSRHE